MGKGAKPLHAHWNGKNFSDSESRKKIYYPLFQNAVRQTAEWRKLKELVQSNRQVALSDFDGYDNKALGMTLHQVIENPARKMGHAFVLAFMLTYGEEYQPQ
jgi:hypothetical protein